MTTAHRIKNRFLVIDDQKICIVGLRNLLTGLFSDCEIIEATSGEKAKELFLSRSFGMVIMDINLRDINGVELLKWLVKLKSNSNILVVSMHNEDIYGMQTLRLGARGFVLKNAEYEHLELAIRRVYGNMRYISDNIANKILEHNTSPRTFRSDIDDPLSYLSARELEVAKLICEGNTTKDIANKMGLKINTISTFKRHIFDKMQVNNVMELFEIGRVYNLSA